MLYTEFEINTEYILMYNLREIKYTDYEKKSKITKCKLNELLNSLDKYSYHIINGSIRIHDSKNAYLLIEKIKEIDKNGCWSIMYVSKNCYRFEDDEYDYKKVDKECYMLDEEDRWCADNYVKYTRKRNIFYSLNNLYMEMDYIKLKEYLDEELKKDNYHFKEVYVGEDNLIYFQCSSDCDLFLKNHKKELNDRFCAYIVMNGLENN